MQDERLLFQSIPDTVFIVDAYGYVLDHNRAEPFEAVRKGEKLTKYIPDCLDGESGSVSVCGKTYRRQTSPIREGEAAAGYTVLLADVTEEARLMEAQRRKGAELQALAEELDASNRELERYAFQVKELTDYAEQLRIAQVIHDDAGHTLTELHTIARMCLALEEGDPRRQKLLEEGADICRRALGAGEERSFASLRELLGQFAHVSRLPVDIRFEGEEPAGLSERYPLIARICREAYHNTLDHSFADRMAVDVRFETLETVFRIADNGHFHGSFEKGFGLASLEESVLRSGGTCAFTAEEGEGFAITVKWRNTPYDEENEDPDRG